MIVLLRHITRATACAQHHFWPTQEFLQARSQAGRCSLRGSVGSHTDTETPPTVHSSSVCGRAHRYTEQEWVWGQNVAHNRRAPSGSEMDESPGQGLEVGIQACLYLTKTAGHSQIKGVLPCILPGCCNSICVDTHMCI